MSDLYSIRVADLPDENTCVLDIQVVHPDSMYIAESPGFALMLLHDEAGDAPLAGEVDLDTAMDPDWAQENARGFIDEVEIVWLKNEPPPEAEDDYDHSYWKSPSKWLKGRLRVRVTHPAWRSHLRKGQVWDSASFDPTKTYDACEPIVPDEGDAEVTLETDVESSAGFIPMPKLLLSGGPLPEELEEIVYVPAFHAPAYEISDKLSGIDIQEDAVAEWVGRPVIWHHNDRTSVGILAGVDDGRLHLIEASDGSRGESWAGGDDLEWIGLAAFKAGKRRLRRALTYAGAMRSASAAVLDADVEESRATLRVVVFDPYVESLELNAGSALALLAAPVAGSFDEIDDEERLGAALKNEKRRQGIDWTNELYPAVAGGFIEEVKVTPPEQALPDLDAMERDEVVGFLEAGEWPAYTVEIEATDEAWIEHLEWTAPYPCSIEHCEEVRDWSEGPRVWDVVEEEIDEHAEPDDDGDDDDEAYTPPPVKSALRRRFTLSRVNTAGPPLEPGDPRAVLRAHGYCEDLSHKEGREGLLAACKEGHVEAVRAYVALGADLEVQEEISEETPLIRATEGDHPDVIRALAAAGADLQGRDGGGDTALMTAVNWEHPDAARTLLELGADPDAPDNWNNTPLCKALKEHEDFVDLLLEGGASPNADEAASQDSAMHWAVFEPDEDRLARLLAKGGAPDLEDREGQTLLCHAVFHDNEGIARILVEKGAELGRANRFGWRPADIAALEEKEGLVELLGGAEKEAAILDLLAGASSGDEERVGQALEAGADVNARDPYGRTALHRAATEGEKETCALLLERGADPAATDGDGDTAIAGAEDSALALLLLDKGVPPNSNTSDGKMICKRLDDAIDNDDHELIKALLDAGGAKEDLGHCHSTFIWGDWEGRPKKRAKTIELLAKHGADLEAKDDDDKTLLYGYADRKGVALVKALLKAGVNVNAGDKNRDTALHKVCDAYDEHEAAAEIAGLLLEAGADVTALNWLRQSPWECAKSSDNEPCKALLERRFDDLSGDAARANYEVLLHLVRRGETEAVRELLAAGLSPNTPVPPGELVLAEACERGDRELLELLLEHGADPTVASSYGSTALVRACSEDAGERRVELVERLLEAGADPNHLDDSQESAVNAAASTGDVEVLEALSRAGAAVDPAPVGYSPLIRAVRGGKFEAAEWLLDHGAHINLRSRAGETPLHHAVEKDEVELALALIAAGADVNVRTVADERVTPLIVATKAGNVELIQALLEAGADPRVTDGDGQSALDYAALREELGVLFPDAGEASAAPTSDEDRALPPLLRAIYNRDRAAFVDVLSGADPDTRNYRGDTALMMAVAHTQRQMVHALLEAGADVTLTNERGDNAWSYAFLTGDELRADIEAAGLEISMDALNQMASQSMRREEIAGALSGGDLAKVAKLIASHELDVNYLTPGRRPLEVAIDAEDGAMVELLKRQGADPALRGAGGETAIERAAGQKKIVATLKGS